MSWLNLKQIILGIAGTTAQKFTLQAPDVPDGSAKLSRGVPGALGQDIATIDANGYITAEQTPPATDNTKKIVSTSWAALGFAVQFGTSGYIKFPDWMRGVILQWGNDVGGVGSGDGNKLVTFPMAFPNNVYAVIPAIVSSGATGFLWSATVNSVGLGSMNVNRRYQSGGTTGAAGESFFWIAVGR